MLKELKPKMITARNIVYVCYSHFYMQPTTAFHFPSPILRSPTLFLPSPLLLSPLLFSSPLSSPPLSSPTLPFGCAIVYRYLE